MKTFISVLNIIYLLWLSACCSTNNAIKNSSNAATQSSFDTTKTKATSNEITFDSEKRLVIARLNGIERNSISSIDEILKRLFAEKKPLVLYVHGLGDEPKKTADKKILEKLEHEYKVKVLMFNWDSKFIKLPPRRPTKEADESAQPLGEVITKIANYRKNHPESASVPISLLVHSMGNIVLEKVVKKQLSFKEKDDALFTNILMTASDADAKDHHLWVEKLKVKGKIIVVVNKDDGALSKSDLVHDPLGNRISYPLAENTFYLNITGLVDNAHRYFQKGRQNDRVAICNIFTSMLQSEPPDLAIEKGLIKKTEGRILIPIEKKENPKLCFTGVKKELDSDSDD